MNKKRFYILASTLLLIGLSAGLIQYVGTFDALYAAATNPGHSWSQMEGNDSLLISTANGKVIVQDIQVNGNIYDHLGNSVPNTATLRFDTAGATWDYPLTWGDSTHTSMDCTNLGGTVVDTGNGTICKLPSSTVPTYWKKADQWQRYATATWGGDGIGQHKSTGPAVFSNAAATRYYPTGSIGYYRTAYINASTRWYDHQINSLGDWLTYAVGGPTPGEDITTNRVEVGIY